MVWDWKVIGSREWREERKPGELLPPGIYECVFCQGQGKTVIHNRKFPCRICKGKGTIEMKTPSVRCLFCNGMGKAESGRDLPCIVCKGMGLVPVKVDKAEDLVVCPDCKGNPKIGGKNLPCMTCKGIGVIPKEKEEKVLLKEGKASKVDALTWTSGGSSFITGSEVEALEKLADLGGRAHFQQIARKMGRNSNYARIICRTLGKADYIDFSASGVAEITVKGIGYLRNKGLLTEERVTKMKEKFEGKEETKKEIEEGWKEIETAKAKRSQGLKWEFR